MLRSRATGWRAAPALVLLAGLIGFTSGQPAAADPVSLTQTYECVFPIMEEDPLTVTVKADLPAEVKVGERIPAFRVTSVSEVSKAAATALRTVGGVTLEGTATADVTVHMPEGPLNIGLDNTIPKTPLPQPPADFQVTATGQAPALTFRQPGNVRIDVNSLLLTMTPRDTTGAKTALDTFETECALDPGDQDKTLHTVRVEPATTDPTDPPDPGGEPEPLSFGIKGSSYIKAAKGSAPLTGGIHMRYAPDTGIFDADLELDPSKGQFTLLGFLPTITDLAFEQKGKTTGTLGSAGSLTSHSEMYVKLTAVSALGLPIGGGPDCGTTEPAEVDLVSEGRFQPHAGGRLKGTYTLPGLTDCGALNDIISTFTAGPGNTIDLALTYKN
ncbi:hypothetical protein GCM10010277_05100 [Streptomyces longisporoflavus]|uniref:DUF6801 domain-containing protein n=1 Tax=Streptomyces longisporoflavus TaxID=28044 RepID=UPI00167CCD8C|nr:DUF6801 domain-containing protein [Streptomyces longisporoflavus]GGV24682.1 hypothetical protein GCM10010277_05100 [Streptomyces longisporoflavus]